MRKKQERRGLFFWELGTKQSIFTNKHSMATYTAIVEKAVRYGISTPKQIADTTNESCENVEHALCQLLKEKKIIAVSPKFKMYVSIKASKNSVNLKTLQKNCQMTKRARRSKLRKRLMKH